MNFLRYLLAVAGLMLTATTLPAHAQASKFSLAPESNMPRIDLVLRMYRVNAEVAATNNDRMQGLMQRTSMGANQGMLFVFPVAARHCMWMKNTLLPLAVAFIDDDGKIINIAEMLPKTENNHCAEAPARYALEMNARWYSGKGIGAGLKVLGLDKAPPPRD